MLPRNSLFRSGTDLLASAGQHRSPFTVHRSLFAVHRSPFAVRRSPFAVRPRSAIKGRHQTQAKLESILTFAFSVPLW